MGASDLNRVELELPDELADALEALAQQHEVTPSEMLERALCDQRLWVQAARDIKANAPAPIGVLPVRCPCCAPYACKNVLVWRGKRRCACTPERIKGAA